MKIEHQIRNYPGCKKCSLLANALNDLEYNPEAAGKHVILTQCNPKLAWYGHSATFVGVSTDEGRIDRLKRMSLNDGIEFTAQMVVLKLYGNCIPLIEEKSEQVANKILDFLHPR